MKCVARVCGCLTCRRRRDIRREYLVIYKKKLTITEKKWKKDADAAKLTKFEEELTAEDIIFFRSLAEMSLTKVCECRC